MPVIKTPIDCDTARFVGKGLLVEQYAVNLKHPCPNYKGQLRGHPSIPPMKNHLPCPPRPERVEKAMEEHDAAYLMNQNQKELEAENKRLKEAKEELLLILKKTCTLYNINAQCQEYVDKCKHGLAQSCSVFRTIQKHDGKDGEK